MDSGLKFKFHIQKIIKKSVKLYGWMVRTLVSSNAQLIMRVYKSIIRPNLEYASSVWNPVSTKLTQSIVRVQHKITKLILGQTLSYQNIY